MRRYPSEKEALAITIDGKNIAEVSSLSISRARDFFMSLSLTGRQRAIGHQVLKEIIQRLGFCIDVGLDYLTLDRKSSTLSGGEAQRVRLATQVGSGLVGVLYILDEPSIGLHPRDTARLINTLKALRDMGNTLIVVEHDASVMMAADHIVDLGPGAGRHGGKIIFNGPLSDLLKSPSSLTGKYLRNEVFIPVPQARRAWSDSRAIVIHGASEHNLKNIDVKFPLGVFICVTGVSGSGKSTLINDILYKAICRHLYGSKDKSGRHKKITGMEFIDKAILVDQEPIGRTPRSNPATYTGVYSAIRDIFSKLPDSRSRGYRPGRFSFNVKGGRCEACGGDGIKKLRCTFCQTYMLSAMYAKACGLTKQLCKFSIKESPSPMS